MFAEVFGHFNKVITITTNIGHHRCLRKMVTSNFIFQKMCKKWSLHHTKAFPSLYSGISFLHINSIILLNENNVIPVFRIKLIFHRLKAAVYFTIYWITILA